MNRRRFLSTSAGTVASVPAIHAHTASKKTSQLAILGGKPVRSQNFPDWPPVNERIQKSLVSAYTSGAWCRIDGGANQVKTLEKKFAELMGAKRCVATGSGTQALHTAFGSLGIGAGDEVLVVPHTYVASVNVISLCNALPIFVDIDRETFQMDPTDLEKKIGAHSKGVEPVHISGLPCDMDRIMSIAKKHDLKVVEDACQAHLSEYKGRKCGTFGDLGCFSFQSSKVLPCGEGGAVIGNNDEIMDKCFSFQNLGTTTVKGLRRWDYLAPKYRMNEIEASILLPQLNDLEKMTDRRNVNAAYLTERLKEIPGIVPQKPYKDVTRASHYLYGLRYRKEHFNDLPRQKFYDAVRAEGIPLSLIYAYELNKMPFYERTLNSAAFKKIYSKNRLNRARELNHCPNNSRLATEEGLWLWHQVFLGIQKDIDDIVDAFIKVYENKDQLV